MDTDYCFDGINIVEFAQNHSTPFYLFSENILLRNFRSLTNSARKNNPFTEFHLAYSVKNNCVPLIVNSLKKQGCLFEVTSSGEMALLHRLGIPLTKCIYTNIWKPEDALKFSIEQDLGYFAIDSLSDKNRVSSYAHKLGRKARVLIRVNPSIEMRDTIFASSTPYSKTGVEITDNPSLSVKPYENAYTLTKLCLEDTQLNVVGLHGHVGSQVTNTHYYREFSEKICAFYKKVETDFGVKLKILDLGGGIPVPYRNTEVLPSVDDIMKIYANSITKSDITPLLIMEIGRYLTAHAGILVTRVVAIKQSPNVGTIVVTDASAYNNLLDSVLVHWDFDMSIANKHSIPRTELVWVVGSTTDSIDAYDPPKSINARRDRRLQKTEEGDLLVIFGAGAYTTCFNMNYCLQPISPVYFINQQGVIDTARRRQTIDEMFTYYSLGEQTNDISANSS